MGNRLSKIYTKTGDQGTTAVSDGVRIPKSHPRICTLGAVDQLNAAIGLLCCNHLPDDITNKLNDIQHRLFDIGGELSMPELISISQQHLIELEAHLDMMNEQLPPLKEFILPGGSPAAAQCHVVRTQCRIAETQCIQLMESNPSTPIRPEVLAYMNRLSDWFFVCARFILKWEGKPEVLWQNPYSKPES